MTRAPCRRRTGTVVPRTEIFGDLITADHKVLRGGFESRNNHRYAVVLHDLATSMDSILSVKNKDFTGRRRVHESSSSPRKNQKLFIRTIHWNLDKSCEDLSWNHRTSTPHRSETHVIAERAVRSVKEGTSAVLPQSGLDERWWSDSMECYCYLRSVQDRLAEGKTPCERQVGEPFEEPIISFGAMVEYHPISAPEQSKTSTILATKFYQESFLGRRWSRGEFGKEIFWLRIWKNWEIWTYVLEESMQKKYWYHKAWEEFIFPVAGGTAKLSGRDYEFREPTPRREQTVRSEDLSRELQGEPGEFQPTESKGRPLVDSRRLHLSSSQWTVPKEETFPNPLNYIDVTRSTHTDLERHARETYWWLLLYWERKPPRGYTWSWRRLTKVQTTKRPDHVWPEVWTNIGKVEQNREKQEWENEKPKLDNARRPRGIYFIDPDDQEYKVTLKKARRKFERPVDAAVPCKRRFILAPGNWLRSWMHLTRFQNTSMFVQWNPMKPQGNEWNLLFQKTWRSHCR